MRSALLALMLMSCTNPDEIIPLSGRLASVDPVEGQAVRLLRNYAVNGVRCLGQGASLFKETQATADGKFGFEVFRVEAQSFGGFGNYCFRAETSFPSGSAAWSELGLGIEARLSPFRDWRAGPRLEGEVLSFEPPIPWPVDRMGSLDHRAQFTTTDGGIVWRTSDRRVLQQGLFPENVPIVLDTARLEDFSGTVSLEATTLEVEGSPYDIRLTGISAVELRSGEELALSGSRVPLSRGLPCEGFASPCPLTDGDLTMVDAGFRDEVTLELPTVTVLSALVLRGAEVASFSFTVELGQADGGVVFSTQESFPMMASAYGAPIVLADGGHAFTSIRFAALSLDAGVPVQRVTLRFPNGLLRIAELSLFE